MAENPKTQVSKANTPLSEKQQLVSRKLNCGSSI